MSTFSASIQADIKNFEANIGKATQSIDKFTKNVSNQLDKVGDSFIKTGTSISKFVSVPLTGLIAGMGALAISTAQATKDLDSLSTITGISTDMLQEYELIAIKATVPTDALANATSSLTRRLRDVSEDGAGASDVLKQLGVSLKDASGEFKTAGQLSEEAIFALADLGGGIEASALGVQLFGRQWEDVTQIVDLGKDQIQALKQEAHDLGLVMSEDSVKASANFGIAIDTLKLRFTALKNQIGTALAPMLTDTLLPIIENQIMPAIGQFVDFIKQLIDRFNELSTPTKTIIASITGIAIALGPTLISLGGLLKLLPLIGAGFTAMTGPIGIAIGAIVAGAVLIVKNWDAIKEYFTSGGGSEMFENVKSLALNLWDSLKSIFTNIRDVVMDVWDRMGSGIVKSFKRSFDIVISIISFVAKTFDNFLNIFRAQSVGDALGEMKVFFVDAFNGVKDIVLKVVAQMTQGVANFFRFLKLNSLADTMEGWADSLVPVVEKTKEQGKEQSKTNVETEKAIALTDELSNSLNNLSEGAENYYTTIKKLSASDLAVDTSGIRTDGIINIDVEGLSEKMKAIRDVVFQELQRLKDEANTLTIDLGQLLSSGISNAMQGLGNALANGDNMIGALGGAIIGTLGNLAQQVGAMMITFGIGAMKLKLMLANPLATIAAGAALVALGSLAVSSVNNAMNSGIGGGGYSGGGYSGSRGAEPMQQGAFELRDSYTDSFKPVEFEIRGDKLVGILEKQSSKNNRLR